LSIIEANVKTLGKSNLSEADREKKTDRIQGNLNRLKDLQLIVQEIVDTPTYRPTPLRLTEFINDTIDSLGTEFSHRNIKFTTRLESVGTIVFDQRILELIHRTLIKNAVENTPDGGEIVVSLSRVENGVCLEVMDYGIGIPAKDRDFIFKAFHHTRHTALYSTRKPFEFNAGGKGLELMRLKILSGEGAFDIDFTSDRCRYIPNSLGKCCGRISECGYIENEKDCQQSGRTTFSVLFHLAP
jgi:two-component system phosphate regulon sensor histidine kinase PhoR